MRIVYATIRCTRQLNCCVYSPPWGGTVMSDYPKQVEIGSGKFAATYERRADELILQFDTSDKASISQVLARFGLQLVEYPDLRATSALSTAMQWVRVPAEARDDLPEFARRLLAEEHLPSRITMAAPVY